MSYYKRRRLPMETQREYEQYLSHHGYIRDMMDDESNYAESKNLRRMHKVDRWLIHAAMAIGVVVIVAQLVILLTK